MPSHKLLKRLLVAGGLAATAGVLSDLRVERPTQPYTDLFRRIPVEPRGDTALGLSFRPRQAEALGLDVRESLAELLRYPYEVIRLAAYWDRTEPTTGHTTGPTDGPTDGVFDTTELDWQLDEAERAGKKVILCLGPVKSFGYPEYFVPPHRLSAPLPEGRLVDERSHPELLESALEQLTRLVERYRDREVIQSWQVEHEAVDPLGMEHSWRLAVSFVQREVRAVREADPTRPVVLNGFLPTSTPVLAQQWWRTRDQGDSVQIARELADVVGIDFYPQHAIAVYASWGLYLRGAGGPVARLVRRRLLDWAREAGREVIVAEGQAEPWESVTVPPSPDAGVPASCPPERLIDNYNAWMRWTGRDGGLGAYLFWGAEYWLLRAQQGDRRYLDAFARVLGQG